MNNLFLEGLLFSSSVIGILAILAWWLYLSPAPEPAQQVAATSPRLSRNLALLIGAGAFLISVGGYWDASEHIVTGIVPGGDDFLWPPHLMLYGGFLIAFVIAIGGLIALAVPNLRAGVPDPRHWVRHNPYVGAIVLMAGYGLFSIPGDALWHELYGLDLTAWSPPHIFLVIASSSTPLFAAGLLLSGQQRDKVSKGWRSFTTLSFLALALSELFLIATLEWEIGFVHGFVAERPVWLYPTIIGVIAFLVLTLARQVVPGSWTATTTALLYFGWRIGVSAFAEQISGAPPRLTLVFILGAVLLDLVAQRRPINDFRQSLLEAGAFTVGYAAVALPTIHFYLFLFLPRFTVADHTLTILLTFLLAAGLQPAAVGLGRWLVRYRADEAPVQPTISGAVEAAAGD